MPQLFLNLIYLFIASKIHMMLNADDIMDVIDSFVNFIFLECGWETIVDVYGIKINFIVFGKNLRLLHSFGWISWLCLVVFTNLKFSLLFRFYCPELIGDIPLITRLFLVIYFNFYRINWSQSYQLKNSKD